MTSPAPTEILLQQTWATWVPARQQWLLATVTQCDDDNVTLTFDARYALDRRSNEHATDTATMLGNRNLFRFVPH